VLLKEVAEEVVAEAEEEVAEAADIVETVIKIAQVEAVDIVATEMVAATAETVLTLTDTETNIRNEVLILFPRKQGFNLA
jgi:F0F1-type ATP synthase membrane subunit b/b'